MIAAVSHSEIVYREAFIHFFYRGFYKIVHFAHLIVVHYYRIEMNGNEITVFFLKVAFYIVDNVVNVAEIALCGHFCMKRNYLSAGAVIVYHHVVDPDDLRISFDKIGYLFDYSFVGSSAQKKVYRLFRRLYARIEYERCDKYARVAVDIDACEPRQKR